MRKANEYELLHHHLTVLTVKMMDKAKAEEVMRLSDIYRRYVDETREDYGIPSNYWEEIPFEMAFEGGNA